MNLEKDTLISHYKILSLIGKGGMGEVYLALDIEFDRRVVVKFLNGSNVKMSRERRLNLAVHLPGVQNQPLN